MLLGIALAYSLSNLVFAFLDHHVRTTTSLQAATRVGLQLMGDAVILTFLVHSSGGLHSPFLPLYLVPVVGGMILLPARWALTVAVVTLLCPWVSRELGPIAPGTEGRELPLAGSLPWMVLSLGAVYCAFLSRGVLRMLRDQETRLNDAKEQLEHRLEELGRVQSKEHELRHQVAELSRRSLISEMATRIAQRIREPLGIVRARAESLRLSGRIQADDPMYRDLDVLNRNLDVAQRALRGVLAYLPAARLQAEVDLKPILDAELLRIGVPARRFLAVGVRPMPRVIGSHDELELAAGLLVRVAHENAREETRIRVRVRVTSSGLQFGLRFPVEDGTGLDAPPSDNGPEPEDTTTFLRLAIARQVIEKHRGEWRLEVEAGAVRLDVILPLCARPGTPGTPRASGRLTAG